MNVHKKVVSLFTILRLIVKPGGLDLSRRDLDLDLDAKKVSVSRVEKILTVFKS